MERPRLRNVEKRKPLYALNNLPKSFAYALGKEVVYLIATRHTPRLEGSDWEEIFARTIGAAWEPSNIGLDDVVLGETAWGAKTIKNKDPFNVKIVRLISGRNSPVYSYGDTEVSKRDPQELGDKVLEIWNQRIIDVSNKYRDMRTIVLIKSDDLLKLSVFEFRASVFSIGDYRWKWNSRDNLEGYDLGDKHVFTWQPHGSQFTIIKDVPADRLRIEIRQPPAVGKEELLERIGYDDSWIKIVPK
jgi:hypothetical protein